MTFGVAQRSGSRFESVLAGPSTWLTCAGLLLLFAIPGQVLDLMGLGYGTSSGSPLGKVHPGTDLVALALLIAGARAGNPLRYMALQGRRFPGAVALLGATGVLLVFLVKVQRAPFTPLIDTFVLPVLLLPLLVDMPARGRVLIERGFHVFLAGNAVLGIVEFATGWRLVPLSFAGVEFTVEMEWRASGLLGHPLASAATAGLYGVILAMGFGPSMPASLRAGAIALQLVSLAAFGGRTALALTALCLIALLVVRGGSLLLGRRFDPRTGLLAVLVGLAFMAGAIALAGSGFFDQLIDRFADDNGSAKSRAIIFDIFRHLSWQELWLGPDQEHLASVLHLEGIEIGVESFWLGFVVLCGIWMSSMFFVTLALFMIDVMRRADPRALVPLGFYVVIISTTVSLSAKSASLAQFITMVLILMPRTPHQAERRLSTSALTWRPA